MSKTSQRICLSACGLDTDWRSVTKQCGSESVLIRLEDPGEVEEPQGSLEEPPAAEDWSQENYELCNTQGVHEAETT